MFDYIQQHLSQPVPAGMFWFIVALLVLRDWSTTKRLETLEAVIRDNGLTERPLPLELDD